MITSMHKSAIFIMAVLFTAGCTAEQDGKNVAEASAAYNNALYTASYPEQWEVEENDKFVYFKSPLDGEEDTFQENIVMYTAPLEGQSLTDFFQESVEMLIESDPGFTIIEHKEDSFGGVPAYRIVYTAGNPQLKYLQIFSIKGGKSYVITYAAPAETYEKYIENAEKIISSMAIR